MTQYLPTQYPRFSFEQLREKLKTVINLFPTLPTKFPLHYSRIEVQVVEDFSIMQHLPEQYLRFSYIDG